MLYKAPSLQTSVYIQVCVRVLQPLHSLVWSIYVRSCYMYIVAILVGIGVSLLLPVSVVVVHTQLQDDPGAGADGRPGAGAAGSP